ncbi:hypothetical protein MGC_02172 [Candida albicans P37039]|nr:hypothetical protein MGC_02172 [Candida albicans P37039]
MIVLVETVFSPIVRMSECDSSGSSDDNTIYFFLVSLLSLCFVSKWKYTKPKSSPFTLSTIFCYAQVLRYPPSKSFYKH